MSHASLSHSRAAVGAVGRRFAIGLSMTGAVALTILAAQVKFGAPVPFTLQTLVVMLTGALLGPLWGPVAMGGYLLIGGIGAPVFAGHMLFGVTFGYLVGFIAGSWLIGRIVWSVERPGLVRAAPAMAAAAVVMLLFGMAHLAWNLGWGLERAWMLGVAPFVLVEAGKVMAACMVWRALRGPSRRLVRG